MSTRKIVLAGGSGFLGQMLGRWFAAREWEVVILTRGHSVVVGKAVPWDGSTAGPWVKAMEGASVLVNLAGRSVNCRYHARNRRAMMDSRILSTRVLGEAVLRCTAPPEVWLNSSTATIYKHTYAEPHGERGAIGASPEAKDAFSVRIAQAWEEEFAQAETPATRHIVLRTAMVLANDRGTVYPILRRLASLGLGGKMGDGRQYMSWIHAGDFCRAIAWLIDHTEARGVYNIAAPHPLTNAEVMAILRRTVGMRVGLPASRWMLELGAFMLRTETELMIKSRRVIPERLIHEGFAFHHPTFEAAVADLEYERKAN